MAGVIFEKHISEVLKKKKKKTAIFHLFCSFFVRVADIKVGESRLSNYSGHFQSVIGNILLRILRCGVLLGEDIRQDNTNKS